MPNQVVETATVAATTPRNKVAGSTCSIQHLNIASKNLSYEWKRWFTQFKIYLRATSLEREENGRKVALLLHHMGPEALEIFNSFDVNIDSVTYDNLISKFEKHFTPKTNISIERHKFFTRRQLEGESLEEFVTALSNLSLTCDFTELRESLVKDIFTCGLNSGFAEVKQKIISEGAITLDKAVELAKTYTLSKIEAASCSVVGAVHYNTSHNEMGQRRWKNRAHQRSTSPSTRRTTPSIRRTTSPSPVSRDRKNICQRCGQHHRFRCPADGVKCSYCFKIGHYAKMCLRNKNVKSLTVDTGDELFIGSISYVCSVKKSQWEVPVSINGTILLCQLDTGAETNVMSLTDFSRLNLKKGLINVSHNSVRTVSGERLELAGEVDLTCHIQSSDHIIKFHVIKVGCKPILGLQTCIDLKLLKRVNQVTFNKYEVQSTQSIITQYNEVFKGLGLIKSQCRLQINKNVTPIREPLRKIPFKLYESLKTELIRMQELDVISPVSEPTQWVNSIVLTSKKNGSIRVCLDPRNLNKAILRAHYPFPSIDVIRSQLNGSNYFSTLDANWGFWTIALDEESSKLCTFITPFGRFRFKRLPFGISAAPEIFHSTMTELFADIPNTVVYFDDLLIHAPTKEKHHEILEQVLKRAKEINLKFNLNKSQFCLNKVTYMGHVFSKEGMTPDPNKIKAIVDMSQPKNSQELQRFLGMLTYLSAYIKNFSEETQQLRILLKKNVIWNWDTNHTATFNKLKTLITKAPVLTYFDQTKELILSCDASQSAVGAVILHGSNPIAYSSACLTEAQTNYAQIEKELLAIVHGCLKFHQFIFGHKITVHTDHKPLVPLFIKALHKVPQRLQRFMLKIQCYDLNVMYKPGKEMYISDTLSRSPLSDSIVDLQEDITLHINMLKSCLEVSPETLESFRKETQNDEELQTIVKLCQTGWPLAKSNLPPETKPYYKFQEEINVLDGLVFKGNNLVVPKALRSKMLTKIHTGHFGVRKCLDYAKNALFWPNMSNDVRNIVTTCVACQEYSNNNSKEPLLPHEIKAIPWNKVGVDFMELKGNKYLICIDYFSKFIELSVLRNGTNAKIVINELKSIFSRQGIPVTLISDNGPPFNAVEFANFIKEWDIQHITTSPYHSQSNGQVERAIGTIKRMLMKTIESNGDPYLTLLQYRNTPNDSKNSPAQLLMSRRLRCSLPVHADLLLPKPIDVNRYENWVEDRNKRMKDVYNRGATKLPELMTEDDVLFKKIPSDKKWIQGKITQVGPEPKSYIIQSRDGMHYRRNRVHIKKFYKSNCNPEYGKSNNTHLDLNTDYNIDNNCNDCNNYCIYSNFDNVNNEPANDNGSTPNLNVTTRSGRQIKVPNKLDL
ncbi:hypothetical protein PPYR_11669 [Photinus pyralis]|uniref:RNA-directed DNA polymerase n=1 Tax=Photinus pyralis TaxID=7054 RepID=A0A5N4ABX8_PHOPY|nr:hypothetical protein PPYR_11669 [Photinus pyralis]